MKRLNFFIMFGILCALIAGCDDDDQSFRPPLDGSGGRFNLYFERDRFQISPRDTFLIEGGIYCPQCDRNSGYVIWLYYGEANGMDVFVEEIFADSILTEHRTYIDLLVARIPESTSILFYTLAVVNGDSVEDRDTVWVDVNGALVNKIAHPWQPTDSLFVEQHGTGN